MAVSGPDRMTGALRGRRVYTESGRLVFVDVSKLLYGLFVSRICGRGKFMEVHKMRWILTIATIFLVVGCSENGSSESADGKWLEAPAVLSPYLANTDLIMSGRDKEGCPVVIEDIRNGLDDPNNIGAQGLLNICSTAGMEFGGDVRCKDKRLQVKCR
jgi:hypothetical protein